MCASVPGKLQSGEIRPISCLRGAIGSVVKIRLTRAEPGVLTLYKFVFGIRGKAKYIIYKHTGSFITMLTKFKFSILESKQRNQRPKDLRDTSH